MSLFHNASSTFSRFQFVRQGLRWPCHARCIRVAGQKPFLQQPSQWRSHATTSGNLGSTARQSRFRQVLTLSALSIVFTSAGFLIATAPAIATIIAIAKPPSDAETLKAFKAPDDFAAAVDDFIDTHPLVQRLRAEGWTESRPHMRLPSEMRKHSLTAGTLLGPGMIPVPPLAFTREGEELITIAYLGTELCGHVGMVHGGMLGTILDEGMGRCCFAKLPNKIGVTANLNINYKAPVKAGSYIVMKSRTTKAEGRKAWVEGHIETLGQGEEPGQLLVEATALYIEPKYAKNLSRVVA